MFTTRSLLKVPIIIRQSRKYMGFINNRSPYWVERVGHREMVCYGLNGLPNYCDRSDFPFPALRYKETTGDLQGLFEKQKGNWGQLSKAEKKALYRANYCQTFEEFNAPTRKWMEVIGQALIYISLGIWLFILFQKFIATPRPDSFSPKSVRAQMRRLIDMQANPIQGFASKWDYEKNDWKVKTWFTPPNPFVRCPDDDE